MLNRRICFIGAGSIAEAMIAGLLKKELVAADDISVINKSDRVRLDALCHTYGVNCPTDREAAIEAAHIVILAVKPKDVVEAMKRWGERLQARDQLLISVVAGVSTAYLESFVPDGVATIRSMPNTSCIVGHSATGVAAGRWATEEDIRIAEQLFKAVGTVITLEEHLLDAVTGLAGSGPAFLYYMVEAMEKAGVKAGLEPEIARQLTLQTFFGAAAMLVKTQSDPARLRENISSPGGTTVAGLSVLKSHQFEEVIIEAIMRATERSKEMGQQVTDFSAIKT